MLGEEFLNLVSEVRILSGPRGNWAILVIPRGAMSQICRNHADSAPLIRSAMRCRSSLKRWV